MLRHKKSESSDSKVATLEIHQNEAVMTICNLLECVWEHYRFSLPDDLKDALNDTYDKFLAETVKDYIPEVDIGECELFERVEFLLDKK